jgi:CubicO group peptidase (beta-lactamase class C family)
MARVFFAATLALAGILSLHSGARAQGFAFNLFEQYLEPLRQQAGIPGLSAAILQDGKIIWERGFGHRDVEALQPAMPDTPYPIADLTQTVTAVMLLNCVENGLVDLSEPLGTWVPAHPQAGATLRQILSHAAPPGAAQVPTAANAFKYDPGRYAALVAPLEACSNQPFRKLVAQVVLDRLAMIDSVPGRDILTATDEVKELFGESAMNRYAAALARTAIPYRVDRRGRPTRADIGAGGMDASSGLIASVRDLARYDDGLEDLLLPDTLNASWSNSTSNGVPLPTGLGWFVQTYEGERLVWHFGLSPDAYSSLIVKVPGRGLTLILLANSDGLSGPFALEKGDVTSSLFAKTFLRLFLL